MARGPGDYEELAAALARPAILRRLRRLRASATAAAAADILHTAAAAAEVVAAGWVRGLEAALRAMWERRAAGLPPGPLAVAAP